MTYSRSFSRPLATATASESETITPTMTIDDANNTVILEWVAPINAVSRIFRRLKIVDSFNGSSLTQTCTDLIFVGSRTYVSSTNPADSLAASTMTYTLAAIDLDVFHTAAGDARA